MARTRSVLGVRTGLALTVVVVIANVVGAAVVFILSAEVLPTGRAPTDAQARVQNIALVLTYLLFAVPVGVAWGRRRFRREGGDPAAQLAHERHVVLHGPMRLVTVQAVLWAGAAVLFGLDNYRYGWRLSSQVTATIVLGGITTCTLAYLLAERILRRSAGRVLRQIPLPVRRRFQPGIIRRSVGFWALGTGVPIVGLMLAGSAALIYQDVPANELAVIIVAHCGVGLAAGFLITVGAARAMSDPVKGVREAMHTVERGDFAVHVPVYDGTELGQLQAGFNRMVAGLRERERLRDLFGRQVGRDVAQVTAAAEEVRLGGELRRVAVLFVDLVGSTALAARLPPVEVVGMLNRLFGVVVDVVEAHGGWINKFEGDAALAVFGAPAEHPDAAGAALAAGRVLARRLVDEVPEVHAGIGISAGDAVAGNIGSVRRFEYTVIGDPVNEAARLTECAKTFPGLICAAGRAVDAAGADEEAHWELVREELLRGRSSPTWLAVPRELTPQEPARSRPHEDAVPARSQQGGTVAVPFPATPTPGADPVAE